MPTILLDENIEGYAQYLRSLISSSEWKEFSEGLALEILDYAAAGLAKGASDFELWHFCQSHIYYLLTNNRNDDGPESLEATILAENTPTSLPIFTISDLDRFRTDGTYVFQVIERLFDYLLDTVNLLGTGRLYLP